MIISQTYLFLEGFKVVPRETCSSTEEDIPVDISEDANSELNEWNNSNTYSSASLKESFANVSNGMLANKRVCTLDRKSVVGRPKKSNTISFKASSTYYNTKCRSSYGKKVPAMVWTKSLNNIQAENTNSHLRKSEGKHKNKYSFKDPMHWKKCRNSCKGKMYATNSLQDSRIALNSLSQIDRFSRFIFPLSFFLLNVVYWYIYLKRSERISLAFESF